MQKYGDQPHIYWSVVLCLGSAFGVLSLIQSASAQLAAALLFGPTRCLQWACYFQFLADDKRYPPDLTGRALGYNNVAIGLIADAMPSLLTYLVASHGWGGSKEARYSVIKFACLLLLSLSACFPLLLYRQRHAHRTAPIDPPRRDSDTAEVESICNGADDAGNGADDTGNGLSRL